MPSLEAHTAVCVLRVERQRTGLLITLIVSPDIERQAAQRSQTLTDVGAAVTAVGEFLDEVAAGES